MFFFLSKQCSFPDFVPSSPAPSRKQWERLLNLGPILISPTLKGEILSGGMSPVRIIAGFNFPVVFVHQVEAPAAGVAEAASVYAGGVQQQHAESCGSHHPGHEHRAALHEGAGQPHTRLERL